MIRYEVQKDGNIFVIFSILKYINISLVKPTIVYTMIRKLLQSKTILHSFLHKTMQ